TLIKARDRSAGCYEKARGSISGSLRGSKSRQVERNTRSPARRGIHPDSSSVCLDNRLGDRQSQTAAPAPSTSGRIGAVKAAEELVPLGERDSGTVVIDADRQATAGGSGSHTDRPCWQGVLDRVADYVADDLRDPVGVGDQGPPGHGAQLEFPVD